MRTGQLAVLAFFLLVISPVYAAAPESVIVGIQGDNIFINFQVVKTEGNWSYIPLNLQGTPDFNQVYVLRVLNTFQTHKPYEVISFQVQYRNLEYDRGGSISPYTYGIWVHHKPKP